MTACQAEPVCYGCRIIRGKLLSVEKFKTIYMVLRVYMKVCVLYIALYMALNFSIYVHIYMDFRYTHIYFPKSIVLNFKAYILACVLYRYLIKLEHKDFHCSERHVGSPSKEETSSVGFCG